MHRDNLLRGLLRKYQQKGNFDSTVGMRQRLQTSYIVGSIPTERLKTRRYCTPTLCPLNCFITDASI